MSYYYEPLVAAQASESERAAFIRRTYGHLAGAVLFFIAVEFFIFKVVLQTAFGQQLLLSYFTVPYANLLLMVAFIGSGMLARWWAMSSNPPAVQYMGLALMVFAYAVIFVPILAIAAGYIGPDRGGDNLIATAGIMTLAMFAGLTAAVFTTRKDFSFLSSILSIGTMLALGLIICSILFGFSLGVFFGFAMIALACGFILYDTSNVLHHYRTDMHVAASLELFASVAILFYYVLMVLLMSNRR